MAPSRELVALYSVRYWKPGLPWKPSLLMHTFVYDFDTENMEAS